MRIAFDVDGTLIQKSAYGDDVPRYSVLQLMFLMKTFGWDIIVWSGSGDEYAKRWTEKLGIAEMVRVIPKGWEKVDIAVDDMKSSKLGTVNIYV